MLGTSTNANNTEIKVIEKEDTHTISKYSSKYYLTFTKNKMYLYDRETC
jgi:hypothetical protein